MRGRPRSDSSYGARWTPASVTIAAISSAGVTSKAGLRAAKRVVTSAPARSSIGISAPVGRRRIERRGRRDDVERDAVMARRAPRAPYVPILFAVSPFAAMRSAPVTTMSTSPAAISDAAAASAITACGMPSCLELPRGQPRALEQRPRLVDPDMREQALAPRPRRIAPSADAVAARREPAGVAVGQRARAGREAASAACAPIARQRSTSSSWSARARSARRVAAASRSSAQRG